MFVYASVSASSMTHSILPTATHFASCFPAEAVLSKYNLYQCVCVCLIHALGCTGEVLWRYYRVQDGCFGEERLEQMFPARERERHTHTHGCICVFPSLVYLTQDLSWPPLTSPHITPVLLCPQSHHCHLPDRT